jgi:hypothetical protein
MFAKSINTFGAEICQISMNNKCWKLANQDDNAG